jgi:hypothetical protein
MDNRIVKSDYKKSKLLAGFFQLEDRNAAGSIIDLLAPLAGGDLLSVNQAPPRTKPANKLALK